MRGIVRWLGVCGFALAALSAPAFADDNKDLYDCGEPKCSEWAPKGENTCRTCKIVQCRKQDDQELLVGEKTKNQCYQGHGDPPSEEELKD